MTDININVDLGLEKLIDKVKQKAAEARKKERPFVPETLADSSILPGRDTRASSDNFSTDRYTSTQSLSRGRIVGATRDDSASFARSTFKALPDPRDDSTSLVRGKIITDQELRRPTRRRDIIIYDEPSSLLRQGQEPFRQFFGLFRVFGKEEEEGIFAPDLPLDSEYQLVRLESLNEIDSSFGVVFIGTRNACFEYSRQDWFQSSLPELIDFAKNGGIVVVNSEWGADTGCAMGASLLASDINSAFGTNIRQNPRAGDYRSGSDVFLQDRDNEYLPLTLNTAVSGTFSGGIPLYAGKLGEITCAYQSVGEGLLIRWADSNATGGDPTIRTSVNRSGELTSFAEGLMAWSNTRIK